MDIVPEVTPLTAPYWEGAREGKLMLQRCLECAKTWHPPQSVCPGCQSRSIEWYPSSGEGVVYSYTVVHHPTHAAYVGREPYLVALIELTEGLRVVANVRGCAIDEVEVGLPVHLIIEEVAGSPLPQFTVAS